MKTTFIQRLQSIYAGLWWWWNVKPAPARRLWERVALKGWLGEKAWGDAIEGLIVEPDHDPDYLRYLDGPGDEIGSWQD